MRRKWRCHEHCGVIVTGYRSYNSLLDVMKNFVATGTLNPINLDSYKNYYRHLTEREIEEAAKPLVEDQIK